MLKLEDTFLEKTTKRNREKRGCIFTCFDILLMSRKLEFNCIEMNSGIKRGRNRWSFGCRIFVGNGQLDRKLTRASNRDGQSRVETLDRAGSSRERHNSTLGWKGKVIAGEEKSPIFSDSYIFLISNKKNHKNIFWQDLAAKEEKLRREKEEQESMLSKIKALESKLISGTGLTTFIMLNTKHLNSHVKKIKISWSVLIY